MTDVKKAIELRKDLKTKKPNFRRQDVHKKPKLTATGYRRARGLQSKMRLRKRGYLKTPKVGYGSPKLVSGLILNGLKPVNVSSLSSLDSIDAKTDCAVISATVGTKKKIEIYKSAIAKKITIANVKDSEKYLKELETAYADKKKTKQQKVSLRTSKRAKVKDTKKDSKKKDSVEDKVSVDEKKKLEKEEKDKILQKKQ